MKVHTNPDQELQNTLVIRPEGRLDALGSSTFWDQLETSLSGESQNVLLDLSEVAFLSSAGVGTLIRLVTRVQQMGGSLASFGATSRVKAVLQVVSLEPVLHLRESHQDARAQLSSLSGD